MFHLPVPASFSRVRREHSHFLPCFSARLWSFICSGLPRCSCCTDFYTASLVPVKMSYHPSCSVIGCKPSDRPGRIRHRLPGDEALRLAWLQCIGLPATKKFALVCSRHFAPEDYTHDPRMQQEMGIAFKPALRPGTLPTLFVPNTAPLPAPWSSPPKASQTGETCRCSRAPLLCTTSTQTTQDDCSLPATSEADTQTLGILRTAATQTPRQPSSRRNAGTSTSHAMGPTVSWTPSKAQVFNVVVPAGNGPETVVDATASLVGLSEVYCVQHMGGLNFQVTVKSMASMTLIVDAGCLLIDGEHCPVVPVDLQITNVACLFLPSFVPNEVLVQALSPYGKVLSVNAGLMSGRRGVLTGTRFVRMEMSTTNPVPNYLQVSGHRVTFDYRDLQSVCRRSGLSDHCHAQCTAPFCGRCGIKGHESKGCDRPCQCYADGHPAVVRPVRHSYLDTAAGAFLPLSPASAVVAFARDAVTEEIVINQPVSANDKEASNSGNYNMPCSPASQTTKGGGGSTSAAIISVPDCAEFLNIVKTPDPMTSMLSTSMKPAVASPTTNVSLPTPCPIPGSSAKAITPLRLNEPLTTEVVGSDDINPASQPLLTPSENSFSLGVQCSVRLSPSLDGFSVEMVLPREVKRAHMSATGSDSAPDCHTELQRRKKPRPSLAGSKCAL